MRIRHLFILALFGTVFPAIAHAQVWTPLTSGVTNDLNDIDCVDERTCYVVGGAPFIGGPGIVLKTTDGGVTWVTQATPVTDTARGTTHPLRGVSCPTTTTCYAAGDGGVILKTTDGGSTWARQSVPNLSTFPGQAQPWFWDIWASTATTAVAVGNVGAVYRTTNGGDTWTQLVLGLEDHNLGGVFFVNATTGWLVGAPGLVHKTTDGGATWTAHTAHTGPPALAFSDVSSLDGTTVWASGPFTFVAKSTDGGVNWTQVSVPPAGGFPAVRFLNTSMGWMGGNGGYLTTVDGGATWMLTFTNKFERSIDCAGVVICYMVGDDGTMRRYGTPPPPPQPDLVAGDRALTCPAGVLGLEFAEYRYRVDVTNAGTAASGPFTVRIEGVNAAGVAVGTPINRTITDLAAGASTTIEGQANVGLLNPTVAATVTVRVTADALGQVAESNETNNTGTVEQTCATAAPVPANRPPNPPAALAQRANIGEPDQLPGWVASGRLVAFKAEISDPDPADVLGVDLEVRPVSTAFTGTPTFAAIMHPNPITAQRGELLDPGSYHWRARTKDNHDATSAWVSFGGNAETEVDFTIPSPVAVPAVAPAPAAAPAPAPAEPPATASIEPAPAASEKSMTPTVTPPPAPPKDVEPAAPGPLVGERPVAAVPTAVERPAEPKATPPVPPEEKRAFAEAARRVQLEAITREAPKVLLGVEQFVQEKGIARSEALEALATEKIRVIAETKLPELPTEKQAQVTSALTTFIAYGTEPTTKLGAGERAGVVHSYQQAFGKLPETEQDWQDVMKIAVGRFPSQKSAEREATAAATFRKVYLRDPNATNANDQAAISILSYGLRPAERRLPSEAVAIRSFKRVFKRGPASASDWDTVRCIAYSGAKR